MLELPAIVRRAGPVTTVHAELEALWRGIDEVFAAAREHHPEALSCRAGCADCCVAGLVVNELEQAALERWLAGLGRTRLEQLLALAEREDEHACVLLDQDAACSIYPARPVVCRSFGLPFRVRDEEPPPHRVRLPVIDGRRAELRVVDTCHKNFVTVRHAALHPAAIMDQASLQQRVLVLSRAQQRESAAASDASSPVSLVGFVRDRARALLG